MAQERDRTTARGMTGQSSTRCEEPIRPKNEIEYLQEQNARLQVELQENKEELLSLYRRTDRHF